MNPINHLWISAVIAYFILDVTGLHNVYYFFIIVAASLLIDFDHLAYYVYTGKPVKNLRYMFNYFAQGYEEHRPHYFLFHNFEFVLILLIIGMFSKIFAMIAIGVLIHLLLDLAIYIAHYKSFEPWLKTWFLTYWLIESKGGVFE